jgi:citrate synthase
MTVTDAPVFVPPGLRNVVVTSTELGDVRGEEGFCHFRQYSAVELARTRTFEDVWFLLLEGRLPTAAEAARLAEEVVPLRALPVELRAALPAIAAAGTRPEPVKGLRTALSLLAAVRDVPPLWDADPATRRATALLVCAVTPTILAALHRLRAGGSPSSRAPTSPPQRTGCTW